jgi:hypothetical protein|tara:strand:- start:520 stop:879 length:360 start_codon:yes stop_codon:yes gene_type:complete
MTKKTINISEGVIKSIVFGFIFSFLIVASGHLVGRKYSVMAATKIYTYGDQPSYCAYKCLFGKNHLLDCIGKNFSNFQESNPKILSSSFKHKSLIILLGIGLSLLIYLLKRIRFAIVPD